jgi:broad specificity phosphatase PhoE
MKYLLFVTLLFTLPVAQAQQVTSFILIRHAEKGDDGTKDPDLTAGGVRRAESLVKLLKETKVDAIYSTAFKRTRSTVEPLSRSTNIPVQNYEAFKGDKIDAMLKKHAGGLVIIVGHSNNIPWIANYLTGTETYKAFEDSDYDNLFIVTVFEKGKTAKVVQLTY